MKSVIGLCLLSILAGTAGAQENLKPVLQKGVSVDMPFADHATEMRAADQQDATIVAITAAGKVYLGIQPTEPIALRNLSAATVYVKADSRVAYQKLLTVLDALRGKSVVLLTAAPKDVNRATIVPPYGVRLTISR